MSVQVSARIDESTKQQFDKVCESIGIFPSSAISMFISGVIEHNGIPFNTVAQLSERPKMTMEEAKVRARAILYEMIADESIEKVGNNRYTYYVLK